MSSVHASSLVGGCGGGSGIGVSGGGGCRVQRWHDSSQKPGIIAAHVAYPPVSIGTHSIQRGYGETSLQVVVVGVVGAGVSAVAGCAQR
jgi:hypothetical protein